MLAFQEKTWEDDISKLNPEDKDYKKTVESFREIKEEQKKITEKMGDSFLEVINEEKNKESFYR